MPDVGTSPQRVGRCARQTKLPTEATGDGKLPAGPRAPGGNAPTAGPSGNAPTAGKGNLPSAHGTEGEPSDRCPAAGQRDSGAGRLLRAQAKAPSRGGDVRTPGWEPSHPAPRRANEESVVCNLGLCPVVRREDLRAEGPWFESRGRGFCTAALQLPTPHAPTPAASDSVRPHAAKLRTGNVCTPSGRRKLRTRYLRSARERSAKLPTAPRPLGTCPRPPGRWEASQWRPSQLRTFAVRTGASRKPRSGYLRRAGELRSEQHRGAARKLPTPRGEAPTRVGSFARPGARVGSFRAIPGRTFPRAGTT